METIQARVNPRLLSKADRLFTGTLDGRIIEILQNARRAGATRVDITNNNEGLVTVVDNGQGVGEFSALLDLGKSDWEEGIETAEDPAGVGIFCLAPRELCIWSGCRQVVITEKAWIGEPVQVQTTQDTIKGTKLTFRDDPWTVEVVEKQAVFSGLKVVVDYHECASEPFVSQQAVSHPELGCRVEACQREALSRWHNNWKRNYYADQVLVNFHGQVVQFSYAPVSEPLQFLVDLTGEPTAIRLMLPARTRLVENEAFNQLRRVIELEAFRFIQRRGTHKLPYSEYCRAKELCIELPEAEPVYTVGLLTGDGPEPAEIDMPQDPPLSQCYRLGPQCKADDDLNEANAHLLAALGTFYAPFVPVDIPDAYNGYSWANLATIDHVEVRNGKELARDWLCSEAIVAVEDLEIAASTSDGRVFRSQVCMAVMHHDPKKKSHPSDIDLHVTIQAMERVSPAAVWYHVGGWNDEGDTYDTQLDDFIDELSGFWAKLVGHGEYLRDKLIACLSQFPIDWQAITLDASGTLSITRKDGTKDIFPQGQRQADS